MPKNQPSRRTKTLAGSPTTTTTTKISKRGRSSTTVTTAPPPHQSLRPPSSATPTLSRIPGPSGSTTLPPSPNKPHGAAPSDPSTLSPPSKSFGGQASIFSLPFPPIFPLLGLNLIASFLILGSSDPCFFVLKFVQHLQ